MSQTRKRKNHQRESYGRSKECVEEAMNAAQSGQAGEWKPWCDKFKDEIAAMNLKLEEFILQDKETCILRCAKENDNLCATCKSKPFMTYSSNTRFYKRVIMKHIESHARNPSQRLIIDSLAKSKADAQKTKEPIRKAMIQLMKSTGVPFKFFSSGSFRNFLEVSLKNVGGKHMIIDQMTVSDDTIAKFAHEEAENIREELKELLPKYVKEQKLSLVFDHKHTKGIHDSFVKVLGIEAAIRHNDGFQYIMLAYIPMNSSNSADTVPQIRKILSDYDILDDVLKSRVPLCCDQAAEASCKLLSSNYSICGGHSISCCMKRTCTKNLNPSESINDTYDQWNDLSAFIEQCDKHKKNENLPAAAAYYSINSFFRSSVIEDEENTKRFAMAIVSGKWYESHKTETELKKEADAYQERFKKRGKTILPCEKSLRFRKFIFAVNRVNLNEELISNLAENNHPQHHLLRQDCPLPDFLFSQALEIFLNRASKTLSLMESSKLTDGSSYFAELENLLLFCIKRISNTRNYESRIARSLVISILEQLGCRLNQDGHELRCHVPKRITNKDKAALYLTPSRTFCDFQKVCEAIGNNENMFLKSVKRALQKITEDWRLDAETWIRRAAFEYFLDENTPDNEEDPMPVLLESTHSDIDERLNCRGGLGRICHENTLEEEFNNYRRVNGDDLNYHNEFCKKNNVGDHRKNVTFWKKNESHFPKLGKIAIMLHNAAISSSSIERAFSWTTLIYSTRRMSLEANTILDIALAGERLHN